LGRWQVLRSQNLTEAASRLLILTSDKTEVAVIAPAGHEFADHDLKVVLFVMPVPDIAAVDADDDRCLRERLTVDQTLVNPTRLLAAEVSSWRAATLCRWRRMVEASAVLPIGRTSLSRSAVMP
jgi:hypothetical protein